MVLDVVLKLSVVCNAAQVAPLRGIAFATQNQFAFASCTRPALSPLLRS
jgi:hypothetical protein